MEGRGSIQKIIGNFAKMGERVAVSTSLARSSPSSKRAIGGAEIFCDQAAKEAPETQILNNSWQEMQKTWKESHTYAA